MTHVTATVFTRTRPRATSTSGTGSRIARTDLAERSRLSRYTKGSSFRIRNKGSACWLRMGVGIRLTGKMIRCMVRVRPFSPMAQKGLFITLMVFRLKPRNRNWEAMVPWAWFNSLKDSQNPLKLNLWSVKPSPHEHFLLINSFFHYLFFVSFAKYKCIDKIEFFESLNYRNLKFW